MADEPEQTAVGSIAAFTAVAGPAVGERQWPIAAAPAWKVLFFGLTEEAWLALRLGLLTLLEEPQYVARANAGLMLSDDRCRLDLDALNTAWRWTETVTEQFRP